MALIAAVIAFAWSQGQRTPEGRPRYVALGSSFAAGAGLGPLQKDSPLLCARSVNGYPQQLARMRRLSIVDMSCGGAVTKHILRGGQFFQGPQLRVIDADTRLVTITTGGNDVGYVGDLSLLALRKSGTPFGWLARTLWKGPTPPAGRDYARLRDELLATLAAVRARAPKATIVVATYPTILPPAGTCPRLALSAAEADLMRRVADRLAATTRAAAEQGGTVVVDMHGLGGEHNACSASPWTRGWTNGGPAPFHPTLEGAAATAQAISNALQHVDLAREAG
jgi:lysophospholipase L1-like esterase